MIFLILCKSNNNPFKTVFIVEIMNNIKEIKRILEIHKPEIERKFHVRNIGIFGSFARGEQRENSDLEILVELNEPLGFEFVEWAEFLEEILKMDVDLVSRGSIKTGRWQHVKEDLIYV